MDDSITTYCAQDWRDKVAAMTETDDVDIEKTFSDIASGFVANKVGDLMKDEHRIGFEIVKKNEDNTRLLGIFAFKVDKDLIFAPVFFLSGEIKGPLLYRCDTKQFVPANKEWANYLIESIEMKEGRGINKSISSDSNPRVHIDKLLSRPKSASISDLVEQEFGKNISEEIERVLAEKSSSGKHILRSFLEEPDVGEPAAELVIKAASMEGSDNFVEYLAYLYGDPGNLIPEVFTYTEKKASSVNTDSNKLELHVQLTKDQMKNAPQYFKDGFFMVDGRGNEYLNKAIVVDSHLPINSITEEGVYDLMSPDGSFSGPYIVCMSNTTDQDRLYANGRSMQGKPCFIIIDNEGKLYFQHQLIGATSEDNSFKELKGFTKSDTVSEGNIYIALNTRTKTSFGPFLVKDKKTADNIDYIKINKYNTYTCDWSPSDNVTSYELYTDGEGFKDCRYVVNKEAPDKDKVFGENTIFIKIKPGKGRFSSSQYIKSVAQINKEFAKGSIHDWLSEKYNAKPLKITFDKIASSDKYGLICNNKTTYFDKLGMMIKLSKDLKINSDFAYNLITSAESGQDCTFLFCDDQEVDAGFQKSGSRLRIADRPDFEEYVSEVSGLPEDRPQSFVLDIVGEQNFPEPPTVGDALNPTTATGLPSITVATTDPSQLRQLADAYNLPNVFEHGVVGTLADTFDASSLLDKYIPKLQDALDSLGRTKFLFYWKPDDFEKAFGRDDMTNLEAQIDTNYNQFGDLVLTLLKKVDKKNKGQDSDGKLSTSN